MSFGSSSVKSISNVGRNKRKYRNFVFLIDFYRGGGINGSGGDHKSQHNQHSTSGRNDHRTGLDQPGQYATLSKQCKTLESSDFY